MNFYKRYVGDYMRDTAHLSLAEHGAYTVLLDAMYANEKTLPADLEGLYRICRATSKAEKSAVASVAGQFFPVNGDGTRHNKRADVEIEKHLAQTEHNRIVGIKGGRPKKPGNNPSGNPEDNPEITQVVSGMEPGNNPNQNHRSSRSTNQPPDGGQSVWDFGITLLTDQGLKESSARSFIASLLNQWDSATVESALRSATGKVETKAYVLGVLKEKPKKGETRFPI